MQGRRLADAPIGSFPVDYDDLQPGDYWFVTVRRDHPEFPRRLNVKDNLDDQLWWRYPNNTDDRFKQNLTGLVLGIMTPDMRYGMLSIHTVRDEDDGTVSVRPGDGSSNSILVSGGAESGQWHGYIEHGVWQEC